MLFSLIPKKNVYKCHLLKKNQIKNHKDDLQQRKRNNVIFITQNNF